MSKAPTRPISKAEGKARDTVLPLLIVGVDVAKAEVVVAYEGPSDLSSQAIPNNQKALTDWLLTLPESCHIGLESTNRYHQLLADLAHAAGHIVYVLNPKQIKHYRTATSTRAKTDLCDAALIARFLDRERLRLHPYRPLKPQMQRLNDLLHSRATVIKSQTQMHLSLEARAEELGIGEPAQALMMQFKALLKAIDFQIEELLKHGDVQEKAKNLSSIVGIGPLTTAALTVAFERADFISSDALIAFFGLDPRPRDSGQSRGRRRLSKQGDSEVRRLLFNAARSASRSEVWKDFFNRYKDRGLSTIEATCILARKLLRIAWAINKNQTPFCKLKVEKLTQDSLKTA